MRKCSEKNFSVSLTKAQTDQALSTLLLFGAAFGFGAGGAGVSATGIEKVRRPDNDKWQCIMGNVKILWSGLWTRA